MVVAETLAKLLTSNSLDLKRKKHPMEQPHFLHLHYCSLKDSGYEQNKNVVWSQGFFFHILNQLNGMLVNPLLTILDDFI